MESLNPFLIVLPLAVLVSCIVCSAVVVRDYAGVSGTPPLWRQFVLLIVSTFLFMNLGALLMSGQSGMPIIVCGAAPSVFFLVVGAAWTRVLATILLCGWIVLGALDYQETRLRSERMRTHIEQKMRDAAEARAEREEGREMKKPEPGVGADSR